MPTPDSFKIGSKAVICHDAELRGTIHVGEACIIHPKATILAIDGPIIVGPHCIIEENVGIINRRKEPMEIGSHNLFEVGSRIEAASIGNHNTFEVKSRVPHTFSIGNSCNIGAACSLTPMNAPYLLKDDLQPGVEGEVAEITEHLADFTTVYGADCNRGKWSGQGAAQYENLYAKHLAYLTETIPKYAKMKVFQPATLQTH